jgi:hypothetical protein
MAQRRSDGAAKIGSRVQGKQAQWLVRHEQIQSAARVPLDRSFNAPVVSPWYTLARALPTVMATTNACLDAIGSTSAKLERGHLPVA